MDKIKTYFPWVIVVIAVSSAIYSWYSRPEESLNPKVWNETPEVNVEHYFNDAKKTKTLVQGGLVSTYTATVNNNPVTGVTKVDCPKSESISIVTTITPSTGDTNIYVKPERKALFGFENQKELGGRYGINSVIDIYGRWTFVRVGNFYGSLYAEANSESKTFAGFEVSYRW